MSTIYSFKLTEKEINSKSISTQTICNTVLSLPKEIKLISMDTGEILMSNQVPYLINSLLQINYIPENNTFKFEQFE